MAKRKKMSKAKKKSKASVKRLGGKAFEAKFYNIRDQIDKVIETIKASQKYGGKRRENVLEQQHAARMIVALGNARRFALQECCQNDQGCTLFMLRPPSR